MSLIEIHVKEKYILKLLCSLMIFVAVSGVSTSFADVYDPQKEYIPRIYFSSFDNPNDDVQLRRQLQASDMLLLRYGKNIIDNTNVLIVKKDSNEPLNSYNTIRQLFDFVVKNSTHGRLQNSSLNYIIYNLFYSEEPLEISCGIFSNFFRGLVTSMFHVNEPDVRPIIMYDENALQPSAPQSQYLTGGHSALEIRFQEFNKWIVFDPYMGVIPELDSTPLSMIEISQLQKSDINFRLMGLDKYGKGSHNQKNVSNFYVGAKDIFGFFGGKQSHILFLKQQKHIEQFRKNFMKSYNKEVVIYTDPESFQRIFY